jgi:hypothetical protein
VRRGERQGCRGLAEERESDADLSSWNGKDKNDRSNVVLL